MKKTVPISFQSLLFHIIIIGFLFPRGYNDINSKYHAICSLVMWISVALTWIYWIKYSKLKNSILKGRIKESILQISSYFFAAIIITAISRGTFASGLQQMFAAPSVCVFIILSLKRAPKQLLNSIVNVLCVEFTINIMMAIKQPYIYGIYHTIFLGHIQVVSQYGILAILVIALFWMLYHEKKGKLIYLLIITLYLTFTTDAASALFTTIGLAIAFIIYKWKLSKFLMLRSEIYIFVMIVLSLFIVIISSINGNSILIPYINGRSFVWQSALEKIKMHPILGYGIDGVLLSTFWLAGFNYAHNQLVQNFLDGGFVLAVCFWTMIHGFAKRINKIEIVRYKVLCNACLVALLFVMLFDSTTLYIYMYMILSIIFSIKNLIKYKENCGETTEKWE